jgi:hypothetical protein
MSDSNIPQDFLDLDGDEDHWTEAEYGGTRQHPAMWIVPNDDRSDMTEAMLNPIPGQDDTVTPLKLSEQRLYKFAMAYLLKDGNLAVPGGRYGSDTRTCAPIAIALAFVMSYHSGEPITYYQLRSDMGLVVNSSDSVAETLSESGYIFEGEDTGVDVHELLGDEFISQSACEALSAHFTSERMGTTSMDMESGNLVVEFTEDDAAELCNKLGIKYGRSE